MPHARKLLLFVLLSLADLVLTWALVSNSQGEVYESNPIAETWLTSYGWVGLIVFKAGIVFVVTCLAFLISRYRPRLGGLVLNFGCCAVGFVVIYSCYLVRQQGLLEDHESTTVREVYVKPLPAVPGWRPGRSV